MKRIWEYLKEHIREDFNPIHYGVVIIFLSLGIYFNFKFDFEDSFLDYQEGPLKFFLFYLTNITAYFIPLLSYAVFCKKNEFLRSKEFWIKSLIALALLSYDRCAFFMDEIVDALFHSNMYRLAYKLVNNLMGIFTMILPFYLLYRWFDLKKRNFYGLTPTGFDTKPYFIMLLMMVPLIAAASFNAGFQDQYPMYLSTYAHKFLKVPEYVTVLMYEVSYALNFVSIEFFFRGFLVIGMISVLGRGAVLPMASVYCVLHFGKPPGEAISSIVGGYILGVVAYKTKGIWGGVIVHVGIAWLMELAAFIQHKTDHS